MRMQVLYYYGAEADWTQRLLGGFFSGMHLLRTNDKAFCGAPQNYFGAGAK